MNYYVVEIAIDRVPDNTAVLCKSLIFFYFGKSVPGIMPQLELDVPKIIGEKSAYTYCFELTVYKLNTLGKSSKMDPRGKAYKTILAPILEKWNNK